MLGFITRKIKHLKQTRPKLYYAGAHDGVENARMSVADSLQALEPRIMFDAAGVATGAEVAADDVAEQQADEAIEPANLQPAAANDENATSPDTDALAEALSGFQPPAGRNEIVFIDKSVEDYQTLLSGINSEAELIFIDSNSDGLEQIANSLQNRTDIDAIHIVSHGDAGELYLGNAVLTQSSMQGEHADELNSIKSSLSESADILIYGCNFAEGDAGKAATDTLAAMTDADIAASDDVTGHASLDGDWELEYNVGSIETESNIFDSTIDQWVYTLAISADQNASDAAMASQISNAIDVVAASESSTGDPRATGTYAENDSGLGIGDGIFLTTGNETSIPGNATANDRDNIDNAGDDNDANHPELDAIANQDLNDVSTFSYNFVSNVDKLAVTYILGTEETAAYAPTFNDVFAVIVTDSNGTQVISDDVNSHFTANGGAGDWATHTDIDPSIESNFRTNAITQTLSINGDGITNNSVQFAIGDNTDTQYDSSVFVSYFGASLTIDPDGDATPGSGAAGYAYSTSYDGGSTPVSVVDAANISIVNRDSSTTVQTAVITLTDAQTNDLLDASAVDGSKFTIDTSVANQITLTAIGTQSEAEWQTALGQIQFSNSDTSPASLADRTVTVVLNDGESNSNTAVTTIAVADTSAPAVPSVNTITTNNSQPLLSGTFDSADSDTFTVSVDGQTYTLGLDAALTNTGDNWSLDLATAGQTLADGVYDVTAVSTDVHGNSSSDATFTDVTIDSSVSGSAPVNNVPGAQTVNEDAVLSFNGASTISVIDADGNLASTALSVDNGILNISLMGSATISSGANGSSTVTISGSQSDINATLATLTYQGNLNFNGADTLTVVSTDSTGTPLSDTDMVSITVSPVSDAPTVTDNTVSTFEDTTYTFSLSDFTSVFTDVDGDSLVHIQITSLESVGTLQLSGADVTVGQIITAAEISNLTFTPNPGEGGNGYDSFGFRAFDGSQYSSAENITNVFTSTFNSNSDGFTYSDNLFGGSASGNAAGTYQAAGGETGGGIRVTVGGGQGGNIASGGWTRNVTLATDSIVEVTVSYRLTYDGDFEPGEIGEAVFAIDGVRYGNGTDNGNGATLVSYSDGNANDSGWITETFQVELSAGTHSIELGAFNNQSTQGSEIVRAYFDNVSVNTIDYPGAATMTIDVGSIDVDNDTGSVTEDGPGTTGNVLSNDTTVPATVTAGATLSNDADLDDADGGQWDDEVGSDNWTLGSNVSHTTATTNFPGITNAFVFSPDGSANDGATMTSFQNVGSSDPTQNDASFEIWFKPNDFSTANEEILFETGATTDGLAITLDGDTINFITRDNGGPIVETSADLGALGIDASEFIQVVGVIDYADTGNELKIYVNGSFVSDTSLGSYVDWAGGNGSGLGTDRNNSVISNVGGRTTTDFDGQIAKFNFYETALSTNEVENNFKAIANHLYVSGADSSNAGQTPVAITELPPGGTAVPGTHDATILSEKGATVTISHDGTYTYDHGALFQDLGAGETTTDTFTYSVTDVLGNTDTATVTITITGTDDAPVITGTFSGAVSEDGTLIDSGTLSISDIDTSDNPISFADVPGAAGDNGYGTFSLSSGNWTYTLDNTNPTVQALNYGDTLTDTYTFIATDGSTQQVTVTINGHDDIDFSISSDVASINEDAGDSVTYTINVGGQISAGNTASIDINAGGSATSGTDYTNFISAVSSAASATPGVTFDGVDTLTFDENFVGPDFNFTITAIDDSLNEGSENISVTLSSASSPNGDTTISTASTSTTITETVPVAANDVDAAVEEGAAITGNLIANDTQGNPAATITSAIDATSDAITIGSAFTTDGGGTLTINSDGSYSYLPPDEVPSAGITEVFTYTLTDADGDSDNATLTINVAAINDAPVNTVPGAQTVAEDTALTFSGGTAISVTDIDGNLASTQLSVNNGVLSITLSGSASISAGANGSSTLTISGSEADINATLASLTYQGNTDFNGSDTLTVISTDSDGTPLTDTDTVAITVNAVDDGGVTPTTVGITTNEDTDFTGSLPTNDPDGLPATGAFAETTAPSNGTLTLDADTGAYTYSPNADFNGTDTFVVTVTDADGDTSDVTVTVTVNAVDDGGVTPTTVGITTNEDTDFTGSLPTNDPDGLPATGAFAETTAPSNGTLTLDADTGAYTYSPNADFNGTDTFVVTVTDADGDTSDVTVTVTVNAVDDGGVTPTTVGITTNEDTDFTGSLPTNDPDGLPATGAFAETTAPSNGTLTLDADTGAYTYSPNADFNGTDTFVVTVTDADGDTSDVTVTVTVNAVDDGGVTPTTVGITTNEDTDFTGSLPTNDPDGLPATGAFAETTAPSNGTLTLDADTGAYTYSPNADFNGTDTFVVTVTDADGDTSDVTVTVTVNAVDDGGVTPTTVGITTNEDTDFTGSLPTNDPDGLPATGAFAETTAPSNGTLTLDADTGAYTYSPNADFNGTDTFVVTVTDADGDTSDVTVTVTVNAVDDGGVTPTTVGITTNEDTDFTGSLPTNDPDGLPATGAFAETTAPSNGTLTLDADTGAYTYSPNADFNGTDTFVVTVTDADGDTSDVTVTVTVNAVDDGGVTPTTVGITTNEDTDFTGSLPTNDPDGLPATGAFAETTAPSNGTLTLDADTGAYTYSPNADFNGTDTFVVTVTDADGDTSDVTVTVTVNAVDDGGVTPTTVGITTNEDTDFTGSLPTNDPDGLPATGAFAETTAPSNGTLTLDADTGAYTYSPNADFNGTDTFVVTVTDADGDTSDVTVTVTVNAVDDGGVTPTTVGITTNEDTDFTGSLPTNDPDGLPATGAFAETTAPSNGTLTLDADTGAYTYSPNADFNGTDTFVVTVTDADGDTSDVTVTVTVNAVDDGGVTPTTVGITTNEDTDFTGSLPTNDPDGLPATGAFAETTAPSNGTLTLDADTGAYTYSPNADFNGTDTFVVTVTDADGDTSDVTVTVTVNAVDDGGVTPTTVGITTNEDTDFTGSLPTNDPDGLPATGAFAETTAPSNGTLTLDADTGAYTYSPNADFNGTDTFVVTVTDADGDTSDVTVTVTVNAVDDGGVTPTTVGITTNEDTDFTGSLPTNDPDGLPATGAFAETTAPSNGTLTLDADTGAYTYSPNADFNGTDTFVVTVTDADGDTSDVTVTVTVNAVDDGGVTPTTVGITTNEDTDFTGSLPTNDPDGLPATGAFAETTAPSNGTLTLDADTGAYTYSPNADFNGTDTFVVTVTDADGDTSDVTVTVTVNAVDDGGVTPTTVGITTNEDTDFTGSLPTNDPDGLPATGAFAETTAPSNGTLTLDADTGAYTYSPNADFNGTDTFVVTVTDADGDTSDVTVTVTVNAVDDGGVTPTTVGITTNEDTDFTGSLPTNDPDGLPATGAFAETTAPSNGTLTLDADTGAYTYSPNADFNGTDTFVVTVTDADGDTSDVTVTVTVNAVDDGGVTPTTVGITTNEDTDFTGSLPTNDPDGLPATGAFAETTAPSNGTLTLDADTGAYTYSPNADFNGTDTFVVTVTDADGDTSDVTVTVTVNAVDDGGVTPTTVGITTNEDTDFTGSLPTNDPDGLPATGAFAETTAPSNGTLTLDADTGAYTYSPNADFNGTDTFVVTVTDADGDTSDVTVTVTVNAVDDGGVTPTTVGITTNEDTDFTGSLPTNDPDGLPATGAFAETTAPSNGTLTLDADTGAYTYSPNADFNGTDTFVVTVTDADGDTSDVTVTVTVNAVDDGGVTPTTVGITTNEDTDFTGSLPTNDPDGLPATGAFAETTAPSNGTLTLDADTGAYTYSPNADFNGTDTFVVTVTDADGDTSDVTVTVTVNAVDDGGVTPTTVGITTNEDTDFTGSLPTNDPDGLPATGAFAETTAPSNGTLTLDADTGAYTYSPNADFNGTDTFVVTVTDADGDTSDVTVTVTVNAVDDGGVTPTTVGITTNEDTDFTGSLPTNDPDGLPATGAFAETTAPSNGTLTLDADTGAYTYSPNADFNGTDTFVVTVTDADGDTSDVTVTVTVNAVDDGGVTPTTVGITTNEDTDFTGSLPTNDPDGLPATGAFAETTAPSNGTLTLDADTGAYTYSPNADFNGTDTFVVTVTDADGDTSDVTVTVTVNAVDDGGVTPTTVGITTNEDTDFTGSLPTNDPDGLPATGAFAETTAPSNGTLTLDADTGAYTYSPNADFNGTDTFVVTVTDADGDTSDVTVTVTVNAVDDGGVTPTTVGITTNEDTDFTGSLPTNDPDGLPATGAFAETTAPSNGTLTLDADTGAYTYSPNADFNGTDTFVVTVTDADGDTSDVTVTVTVNAVDDGGVTPTTVGITTNEDTDFTGSLPTNDPDGLPATGAFAETTAPSNGTLTLDADTGAYTYSPNADFNGTDTFVVTVTDADGDTSDVTVTVTVNAVDDGGVTPTTVGITTNEDTDFTGSLPTNDPDGLPATGAFAETTAPSNGTLTLDADTGAYTYSPNADFNGTDTFVVTVTDADGDTSDVTVTVTVNAVDDGGVTPTTVGITTNEDTDFTGSLPTNDPDGLPATGAFAETTAPSNGTLTLDADTGAYTYSPNADFNGTDTFVVTVTDADGDTSDVTVTVTVNAVDDGGVTPTTVGITTNEDTDFTGSLPTNDPDGLPATGAFAETTAPSNGTLTLDADTGAYTYSPNADFNGTDTFVVTVTDADGDTSDVTVTVTVNAVDDGGVTPTTVGITTNEDTDFTGSLPTNDPDGLPATGAFAETTAPSNGTLTLDADTGAYTYSPNADFNGTDTFVVTVTDADGDTSDVTVTVTVNAVDDGGVTPTTVGITTNEDTDFTGSLPTNDPDGLPATGAFAETTAPSNGTLTLDADTGAYTYSPNADFNGTDTFVVTVTDADGDTSDVTVTVTVNAVDDGGVTPTTVGITTNEDTDFTGSLPTNDPDGLPATGAFAETTAPSNGTLTLDADTGAYTYSPNADFNGTDTFVVTVTDADGDTSDVTVTVTVNAVDDGGVTPTTVGITTNEDTDFTGSLPTNDPDGLPATGAFAETTAPSNGTLTLDADTGAYTYSPNADFNGTDTFVVTVTDADGDTSDVTVTVTVNAVDDGGVTPTTVGITTNEDTDFTGSLPTNDPDGLPATGAFAETTAPSNGTLTLDADTGAYTYSPNADFNGTDTFVVTVTDADGDTSDVTVTVTVNAVDDGGVTPTTVGITTNEDTDFTGSLPTNDPDGLPATGAFAETTAPSNGTLTLDADTGAYTYSPNADFNGTDTFVVTVTDADGDTSDVTVTVTVNAVDDGGVTPTTVGITTNEDTDFTGSLPTNDPDGLPATGAFAETTAPSNGTLTLDADTGAYTYSPNADFNGTDTFVVTVTDADGDTSDVTVTVTVNAVDDGGVTPTTVGITTNEDTDFTGSLPTNDPDGLPATGAFAETTAPSNGTLTLDADTGAYTYSPNADFNGTDTFVVTVTDADGDTSDVTVTVTVNAVDDGGVTPTTVGITTNEDTDFTGSLPTNDPDGLPATGAFAETTAPSNGTLTLDADTGAYTYSPNADFNGTDTFVVTVTDADGDTSDVTVTVTVNAVDDGGVTPTTVGITTNEDTDFTGSLPTNDPDGLPATGAFAETTAPSNGTLTLDADTGAYTYSPNADFNGTDTFVVTVTDADGDTSDVTVTVTVNAVDDGGVTPTTVGITTNEDTDFTGSLPTNDPDGLPATGAFAETTAPSNGTLTLDADTGAYTYSPNADFNGTDTFVVTVTDADGDTSDVTVTVTVNAVDDGGVTPTTVGITTNEDTDFTGSLPTNDPDGLPATGAFAETTAPSNGTLTLDADTGAYTYSPNADFNGTDTFVVTVTDADGDTSDVTVTVTVNAVDETPTLNNQTISVDENIANGTSVYDVNDASTGTDLDVDGDAITYSITNGNTGGAFAIDPVTGVISVANSGALDFETNPTFTLEITGSDGSLSDTATVTINLNDIANENAPAISDANVTIDENIANGTSIINLNDGTTSTDTDADGDTIAYSIVGGNGTGPGAFAINSSTGEITVNDSSQLDFETNPSFNLIIEATAGGDTDTATITINLNDLDEIAPANPIIDVIAGNDLINAAEDDAVVITGTAEANSTIDLTVSDGTNTVTRTVTTNGAGVWTLAGNEIDLSGFDQGGITITATATDAAGNTSGVTTATPVHDSIAPSAPGLNTISLDSGTPGDLITNDNTLIFTGNTEANATVEVFVDGISVGTTTADGAGNWSFDYSGTTLADGTYAVTTQATDTAGNTGALSTATNVTIDTTAPSSSANSLLTNDQRPQLTGTVDDPNATVVIDVGGQTGLVATNNGDVTWTLPDNTINPALAEGSYDVTVTTTDVAGNVDNNTISNALVIDTTAPVPTITVDPVTADNIINASEAGGTVNVTGTVSGEFNAGDTVTVTVNGNTYISTVTATGLFTVSVSGSDLAADTTADISVTTTDSAGNVGGGASTHTYVVDVTAPAPTITINTVAGDNILSAAEIGGPVNVSGSVGGSGFSAGDIVTIKVNGNTYTGTIDAGGNFTISVPGSDVQADPDVEASITLTDTAGNTGIANQTLTVTRASAPATDNGSGDDVEPVIENNNSVTSANSQARPSQNILGAQQGAVIDTVSRASSLGTTNALSAEGAVLDAVEGANLSRQGFGQNFDDNLADNVGLWESEGVRGFAVSFSLTEVGRSSDSLSSLFPLRQGIEDVNAEDQLVVKSILRDRTIFLEIDYTIESDPNLYASNVRVTMLDGSALPEWLRADDNGTLLSGEPPVGQEKLQLRIQITLSDETVIVRYVDVNVDSGEIASLQHISEQHVVGSGLFEDKLKLEASKFDSAADVVTKSFFN